MKLNKLGLEIPERTPLPDGSFLNNPKEVEAWISSLPMANIGETSRQIFKTIVEFNRMEIPNLSRIKIAEMFRRPIGYISSNLKKYYLDAAFPLSAKNRKIAVLNRELYIELAIAYKIVIVEMIAGEARNIDRKLLVVAIQRAMRCLASVLYQSVIVYDPYPPGIWGEIHRLYAYAEQNRVHRLPVKDDQPKQGTHTSIGDLFQQILLFAIISPYRLRQREIEHSHQQLAAWSGRVTLGMADPKSPSPTGFIARLGSDLPPSHMELQQQPVDRFCRHLDSSGLVLLLKEIMHSLPDDPAGQTPPSADELASRQLLKKLIQVLGSVQKRRYVRTNLNFELKIAVGLSAIHTLLRRAPEETEPEEPGTLQESDIEWFVPNEKRTLINTPDLLQGASHIELVGFDPSIVSETILASDGKGGGYSGPVPAWVTASEDHPPEPFSCTTDNESAWGYCVHWPVPNTPRIRVGELLGIHLSANRSNQFRIAVSRWLRSVPGQGLQVGLEIIGLESVAVTIDRTDKPTTTAVPKKCILLPASKTTGQSATLLTPLLPFAAGDQVSLDDFSERKDIQLTRHLESTGTFSRFQFDYREGRQETHQESDQDPDQDRNFDTIWSTL